MHLVFLIYISNKYSLDVRDGSRMNIHRYEYRLLEQPNVLVNKTTLVKSLFLVYLSISTCFGRLWAHHQEKKLCFCDACYLVILTEY
jgi:hypothetical protein